jgi:hypothetical protein
VDFGKMENKEPKSQADIEWEQRKLCRDESCIGVIGPDGRCKECGLPYEEGTSDEIKEAPDMENTETSETQEESEAYETDEELEDVEENGEEKSDLDLEWEQRKL